MWSKYITRRLAVQVAQAWNFGWGRAMKRVYGVSVCNTLVFRDSQKTEYYVDESEHKKYIADLYGLIKNRKFIREFHKNAQIKLEQILKETQDNFNQDLFKLSNIELLKLYTRSVLPNQEQFYIRMWTVFNIGEPLANVVKEYLMKCISDKERVNEYLLSLSSPLEPNDVLNERQDILKLVLKKTRVNKKRFDLLLGHHWQKYKHIPMFDFDHEPYALDYFQNEIKKISQPHSELRELERAFTSRKKDFDRIIKDIDPNRQFLQLLDFLKENVFLKDYRDMLRQKYNLELRKFYTVVGERLGLSIAEVATLTNNEVIQYLKSGKFFPRGVVEQRKKAYLLIQKENKAQIYSGAQALKMARKELKDLDNKKAKQITGIVGSRGVARGSVSVIFTNRDLYKVKTGDVLVATMTRQDFVPAIRKAVAIVTDEGSVTCHAAIIARELKKPCIVASRIGTKVFKDGDIVEVDATRGIVRKI